MPPTVKNVNFNISKSGSFIVVEGDNLVVDKRYTPVAIFNGKLAELENAENGLLNIKVKEGEINEDENELVIVSDPFTIYKMKLNKKQ